MSFHVHFGGGYLLVVLASAATRDLSSYESLGPWGSMYLCTRVYPKMQKIFVQRTYTYKYIYIYIHIYIYIYMCMEDKGRPAWLDLRKPH